MIKQVELDGVTYIVEATGRQYTISGMRETPTTEEAILVLRAIEEGKGKDIA
jgi:hypothetical protein